MAPLPHSETSPENALPSSSAPCSCLLATSLRLLPHRSRSAHPDPAAIARHVLSAAERWVKALAAAASENPLLNAISSISGDFQKFVAKQHRISKNQISNGISLSTLKFAAILPGDSVGGLVVANGLANFLNIYNTLLVVRLVLTWFPSVPPAIVAPLSTLCDPYLNIFRGLIPPLGGTLDLSPILAFLVLNAFTSTAAALPAELPESSWSQQQSPSSLMPSNLTTSQEKWSKRVGSIRRKQ